MKWMEAGLFDLQNKELWKYVSIIIMSEEIDRSISGDSSKGKHIFSKIILPFAYAQYLTDLEEVIRSKGLINTRNLHSNSIKKRPF